MSLHNLAEDADHDFILKLISAQYVEVVHKSWSKNIPTLADEIHSTHQLPYRTGFYHQTTWQLLNTLKSRLFKVPEMQ
jgi:hypothetical protein